MGQAGLTYRNPDSKPSETVNSEIDKPPRHEQGRAPDIIIILIIVIILMISL